MTGRLTVLPPESELAPHTHVVITLRGGPALHYVDARRFGGLHVDFDVRLAAVGPVAELGPEPLAKGFDGAMLAERAGRSKRVLRDVLLDQRVVAGLGNIYVSEALHLAGLPPFARAAELRASAWGRLALAIREVLTQGIRNGGTTLRDYRGSRGEQGRNQDSLRAYGRAGLPCFGCGSTLRAHVHAGRSGVHCNRCQPARRRS
jgi:formamidopyrimidine-DNA glycosylase